MNTCDLTVALGIRDRSILETFYSTAIRRSELIKLRVDDVDWERGTILIRQGKGHKDRHVPLASGPWLGCESTAKKSDRVWRP